MLLTAIFTGLRASELRGLTWTDVDLKRGELHVRKRADYYNAIGRPKSASSERTIRSPRCWSTRCANGSSRVRKSELDFVFPSGSGRVQYLSEIVQRGFWPAQIAAGIVSEAGKPKYRGLHSLRHFYASWCINRRVDGGLELPLKLVQRQFEHA